VAVRLLKPRGDGFAAELIELEKPGPERIEPPCPHFQACGGCALQHWAEAPYRAWKEDKLRQALMRRGFEAPALRPLISVPTGSRRRAGLNARRLKDRVLLGFNEAESRRIVDIETCLVLRPALVASLPLWRRHLEGLLDIGGGIDLHLTETEAGIDALLTGPLAFTPAKRQKIATLADELDLARLSFRREAQALPETLSLRRQPLISIGSAKMAPQPGGFLQATMEAESLMAEAALSELAGSKRIADLFAGSGAFGLRLAEAGHDVAAYDSEAGAIQSLRGAANMAGLSGRIRAEARDLERRPLLAAELKGFDALLLDPPRAGAKTQVQAIAAAGKAAPGRIVMASCDPGSFARDARILVDAGYRLDFAQGIDQFLYSPHLEIISAFSR
jgi:23S rRNA (uracil1939-C5)-methyltransferase